MYYLHNIYIKNFKDIKSIQLEGLPDYAKWIFLTGENGFGKTLFLQAIATALNPIDDVINDSLNSPHGLLRAEILLYPNNAFGVAQTGKHLVFRNNSNFKFLCCYGSSRLLMHSESEQTEKTIQGSDIDRLFYNQTYLRNIEFDLLRWKLKSDSPSIPIEEREIINERLNNIVELLLELMNLNEIKIDIINDQVLYSEKGNHNDVLEFLPRDKLGSGYKAVLGFVGDMIIRFFYLQPTALRTYDFVGIVMIDEIELHLHPKWQKMLPQLLSKYFPNIQFVASTHSPLPLLGSPESSVFLKVTRNLEAGIFVERLTKLEKDIKFLLPNSIFTSDIFDLDDIESSQNPEDYEVKSEDNYKEIELNEEIKERLKKLDEKIFPDKLFEDN